MSEQARDELAASKISEWRRDAFFRNNARDPKKREDGERILALIGEIERLQAEQPDRDRQIKVQLLRDTADDIERNALYSLRSKGLHTRFGVMLRARADLIVGGEVDGRLRH